MRGAIPCVILIISLMGLTSTVSGQQAVIVERLVPCTTIDVGSCLAPPFVGDDNSQFCGPVKFKGSTPLPPGFSLYNFYRTCNVPAVTLPHFTATKNQLEKTLLDGFNKMPAELAATEAVKTMEARIKALEDRLSRLERESGR